MLELCTVRAETCGHSVSYSMRDLTNAYIAYHPLVCLKATYQPCRYSRH